MDPNNGYAERDKGGRRRSYAVNNRNWTANGNGSER